MRNLSTNNALIFIMALLIIATSSNAQPSDHLPQTILKDSFMEIDSYLDTYKSGVIITKPLTDSNVQQLDCIDIQHQPALNNKTLKGHKIQLHPSEELKAILGSVKDDDTATLCPRGSVEMKLPTREQITKAGSVKNFLSKYPNLLKNDRLSQKPPEITPPAPTGHKYAVYIKKANSTAAQSTFNIWAPAIENWGTKTGSDPLQYWGEFSLTQLWLVGGTGNATQTAEVGVHVFPGKYGDSLPRLFIYYTPDNYSNGCYNLDCAAFIKTSNVLPIGGILPSSTLGGTQIEGTIAFYRDPTTFNWILFYFDGTNYIQSGYYPAALYGAGQMRQNADHVEFGGEVIDANTLQHTATDMGSGQFPSAGYGFSAYQRNLKYMDMNSVIQNAQGGWLSITNPNCYDLALGTNPAWETSIYFGGAGLGVQCP